jgi:hypothetical protein
VRPVDHEQGWLAPGITGLSRQREWDAVGMVEAPGMPGDEVTFVVLPDGRVLHELGGSAVEEELAAALSESLAPPYRAVAVRREELWAVGGSSIDVVRLDPDPQGDDLQLTWDGSTLALAVDGIPVAVERAAALERLAAERESGPYAARAQRLDGDLFELSVLPL